MLILMRKLYFQYLASNFIVPLMVSTIFFVMFLLTFELFRVMQLMSSGDITIGFILGMMGDIAITLIPMATPLSIFFSTIFCLNKLCGDSEYVALRSFGIQKIKILIPFLIVSSIMAMNIYFLNQQLVPNAHAQVRKKIKIISSTSLIEGIKSGQFFTNIPDITMFPEKVDEVTKDLTNVFLHIFNGAKSEEKVIFAQSGRILHVKDEKSGIESFNLVLNKGNIFTQMKKEGRSEKVLFEEYKLPISEKKFNYKPTVKEIMMNKQELEAFIDAGIDGAIKKGFSERDYFNAIYEYWNRFNTPLLIVMLTFLGFGLGITGTRGRGKNSSGKAILLLILYYVIFFALVSQAREGKIPVPIAMIVPAIVMIGISVKTYRNLDWQS